MADTRTVRINEREPMSPDGIQKWSPNGRNKLHRFIYKNKGSFQVPYECLSNRNDMAQWIQTKFGDGYYQLMFWKKGYFKNKHWQRSYVVAVFDLNHFSETGQYTFENRGITRFGWFEFDRKNKKKHKINEEINDDEKLIDITS